MALGDITVIENDLKAIEILAATAAVNNAPASATAGVPTDLIRQAFGQFPEVMSFVVASTAGSGAMGATFRLWGMFGTLAGLAGGLWAPFGSGSETLKGVVNEGNALGEVATDLIRHAEPLLFPHHASRIYVELVAITGTLTSVTCFLAGRKVLV